MLASGEGSNLQALIDAIADGAVDARLVGVFSDRAGARALDRACAAVVPAQALSPKAFAHRAAFDAALFDAIDAATPDLIVCAGYMRLIGSEVLVSRGGRLVNIHPSLLPAYKGLHTHARVLADGARMHGASVHYVTADLDGGPVLAQAMVRVHAGDDADTLAARVLAREHPLLVATVAWLCAGRLTLAGGRVRLDGRPLAAPLQLGANRGFA